MAACWRRSSAIAALALLLAAMPSAGRERPAARARPAPDPGAARPIACAKEAKSWLVPFATAPFPYDGDIPDKGVAFLDAREDGRRGHSSPRGGIYWEDETYSDRRVLLSVPARFDPSAGPVIVLFLHGNEARLDRDVCRRQAVPAQVAGSGLNAVLVAPQLAVDALDSSAGGFWRRGALRAFLAETAQQLGRLGYPGLEGAPVVIAAYSGGYLPALYGLQVGGAAERVRALLLLDALFGDVDRYAEAVSANLPRMSFVSAYSAASKANNLALRSELSRRNLPVGEGLPSYLRPGVATFIPSPEAVTHAGYMTRGFTRQPLRAMLERLGGR